MISSKHAKHTIISLLYMFCSATQAITKLYQIPQKHATHPQCFKPHILYKLNLFQLTFHPIVVSYYKNISEGLLELILSNE